METTCGGEEGEGEMVEQRCVGLCGKYKDDKISQSATNM